MPCERALPCGHKCLEVCYVQPCRCACTKGKGRALEVSPDHSPPRIPKLVEAFETYVKGGHVEDDAKIDAAAAEHNALKLQQKADDTMAKTLFGGDGAWSSWSGSVDKSETGQLVDIASDSHKNGDGLFRGRWVEMFESGYSGLDMNDNVRIGRSLLD